MFKYVFFFSLQLIGSASIYFCYLLIARYVGPGAQGEFVLLKSFVDLVGPLLLMGLPQVLVLLLNRNLTNIRSVAKPISYYSLVTFLIAFVVFVLAPPLLETDGRFSLQSAILVSLAIGGYVLFSLVRVLYLTKNDGPYFALFSVTPQILLLGAVIVQLLYGYTEFSQSIFAQGVVFLAVSIPLLIKLYLMDREKPIIYPQAAAILAENGHVFVQTLAYVSQVYIFYQLIQWISDDRATVGYFSIAYLPAQAAHTLVGMIAPLLINTWSKREEPLAPSKLLQLLFIVAALCQLMALLVFPFANWMVVAALGEIFEPAGKALAILLFTTMPVVFTRLASPYLQTSNRAWTNTQSCITRLTSGFVVSVIAFCYGISILYAAVFGVMISEWASMAWLCYKLTAEPVVTHN